MPVRSWKEWADRHATLFALTTEQDVKMLKEWCGIFQLAGWTPEELEGASSALALQGSYQFRLLQLAGLQDHVRQRRRERLLHLERQELAQARSVCRTCNGSGRVIVPHLCSVRDGCGPWYTCAVACTCGLGRIYLQGKRPYMSLGDYETLAPDWPALMERREKLQKAEHEARANSRAIDAALGAIRARRQTQ